MTAELALLRHLLEVWPANAVNRGHVLAFTDELPVLADDALDISVPPRNSTLPSS